MAIAYNWQGQGLTPAFMQWLSGNPGIMQMVQTGQMTVLQALQQFAQQQRTGQQNQNQALPGTIPPTGPVATPPPPSGAGGAPVGAGALPGTAALYQQPVRGAFNTAPGGSQLPPFVQQYAAALGQRPAAIPPTPPPPTPAAPYSGPAAGGAGRSFVSPAQGPPTFPNVNLGKIIGQVTGWGTSMPNMTPTNIGADTGWGTSGYEGGMVARSQASDGSTSDGSGGGYGAGTVGGGEADAGDRGGWGG